MDIEDLVVCVMLKLVWILIYGGSCMLLLINFVDCVCGFLVDLGGWVWFFDDVCEWLEFQVY